MFISRCDFPIPRHGGIQSATRYIESCRIPKVDELIQLFEKEHTSILQDTNDGSSEQEWIKIKEIEDILFALRNTKYCEIFYHGDNVSIPCGTRSGINMIIIRRIQPQRIAVTNLR